MAILAALGSLAIGCSLKDQPSTNNHKIGWGNLPVVAADAKGVVHLIYGCTLVLLERH